MSKDIAAQQLPLQGQAIPTIHNEKNEFDEVEHVKHGENGGVADVSALEMESRFAHLNRKQTVFTFWKSILFACMVGLGALFDGYAVVGEPLSHILHRMVNG